MSLLHHRSNSIAVLLVVLCTPAVAQPKLAAVDLYGDTLPPGAIARLGTVRYRHGAWLGRGLSFSADGKTLVTSSEDDDLIQVWETLTGKMLQQIHVSELNLRGFALSRDGKRAAVSGFWHDGDDQPAHGEVRVIDLATGQAIRSFRREGRTYGGGVMLFTPDDKLLVSLADTALRIEEIANGTEILKHVFPHPDNSPLLAMSPDGSTLAFRAGANSDKLYLWTWEAGEEPREFDIRRIRVAGLAFSADGKRLAANGDHDQGIHIWDVETGRILEPLKMPENVYPAGAALYTPDGATLITSAMSMPHQKGVILFWDAKTGRQLARIDIDEEVRRLAISRDASKLAAIARGTIRLWDVATRKELTAIDQGHAEDIGQIVDAGQGEMVTASHDRTIRIWDVVSGRQKRKLQHDRSVRGIALSPDGTRLTSSSFDDSVRVWEFATGKELLKLPGHGQVGGKRVVAFSSDRRNLYSFGDDLKLNVWDATTGQSIAKYEISPSGLNKESNDQRPFGEFFELTAAEFFPGGQQLLVGLHKGFHIFDTAKNAELKVVPRDGGHMFSAALSPDGRLLLGSAWSKGVETKLADGTFRFSAAKNHTVTIWDLATGNVSREVVLPDGGAGPVTFSQDGLFYAVSTSQPTDRITIYKTESGNERLRFDLPAHVRCLTFSRDGKRLITGLHDTTALVWDLDALAAMTR